MKQQINLYQPILRRERKVLSAATLAQIGLVIALGLGLIYLYGHWQLSQLRGEVAQLESQQQQAQAQMTQLAEEAAARRDDSALSQSTEALRLEVAAREHLLSWLGQRESQRRTGFAPYLAGLARQHQGELWLEQVHLAAGGEQITLAGASHDPAAIVRYLRRLGGESAFAAVEFDRVSIERNEDTPDELRFEVSNAPQESP